MDELFASLGKDFVDETAPVVQEVASLVLQLEQAWSSGADGESILRGVQGGLHSVKGNSASTAAAGTVMRKTRRKPQGSSAYLLQRRQSASAVQRSFSALK